jgi:hypothetical protein
VAAPDATRKFRNPATRRPAADGDEPGEAAARDCAWRWKREGRRVRIARPPQGLDFDDMLVARASCIDPSLRVVARDADGSGQDNAPTVRANPLETNAEIAADGMDANITRVTAPGKNDSPGSRAR